MAGERETSPFVWRSLLIKPTSVSPVAAAAAAAGVSP